MGSDEAAAAAAAGDDEDDEVEETKVGRKDGLVKAGEGGGGGGIAFAAEIDSPSETRITFGMVGELPLNAGTGPIRSSL